MEPARKALRVGPLAAAVPMATHHAMLVVSCTEVQKCFNPQCRWPVGIDARVVGLLTRVLAR